MQSPSRTAPLSNNGTPLPIHPPTTTTWCLACLFLVPVSHLVHLAHTLLTFFAPRVAAFPARVALIRHIQATPTLPLPGPSTRRPSNSSSSCSSDLPTHLPKLSWQQPPSQSSARPPPRHRQRTQSPYSPAVARAEKTSPSTSISTSHCADMSGHPRIAPGPAPASTASAQTSSTPG